MKFLHVIGMLDPVYGGPMEGVIQLIASLRALGYYRKIVTLDNINEYYSNRIIYGKSAN